MSVVPFDSYSIAQLMSFQPSRELSIADQQKQWGERDAQLLELFYDRHIRQQIKLKNIKDRVAAYCEFHHGGGITLDQIFDVHDKRRRERGYPAPSGYQYTFTYDVLLIRCELREINAVSCGKKAVAA